MLHKDANKLHTYMYNCQINFSKKMCYKIELKTLFLLFVIQLYYYTNKITQKNN